MAAAPALLVAASRSRRVVVRPSTPRDGDRRLHSAMTLIRPFRASAARSARPRLDRRRATFHLPERHLRARTLDDAPRRGNDRLEQIGVERWTSCGLQPLGRRDHRVELRARRPRVDGRGSPLDAFADRRRPPADEQRRAGVQQHDVATGSLLARENVTDDSRRCAAASPPWRSCRSAFGIPKSDGCT